MQRSGALSVSSYDIPVWGASGHAADAWQQGRYLDSFVWEVNGFGEMFGAEALYKLAASKLSMLAARSFRFTKLETAAANRLGFFPEEVVIKNGVADIPITYMTAVKPSDITTVTNALKTNGATSIRINSGPIINSTISTRIQNAFNLGNDFLGFKIIKTNNPNNMFILEKGI